MGTILNPSNKGFKEALNSKIYVDKSKLINLTNEVIDTVGKYVCVSRPRRFGKTIAASMLTAYYSRGCNSKEIFKKLKIKDTNNFLKYLNKYNVLKINMDDFLSKGKDAEGMISKLTKKVIKEIKQEYPELKDEEWDDLEEACDDVYSVSQIPFIFIIDEWDCLLRKRKNMQKEHEEYLDFLKLILKDKEYVALAYMTGILPIKKYGVHSALNMFTEISMTNPREYAEFTGFTEEEVKELCDRYKMSYEETKKWYDGYDLKGISIYNPRSVVMSMTGHDYDNYWTSTENYEALGTYIKMNFDGLRDTIVRLLAGEKIKVSTKGFTNDMVTFNSKDDVLTLLIHLGYLTYDFYTEMTWIPNNEVSEEFAEVIKTLNWCGVSKSLILSDELLKATINMNEEKVANYIDEAHDENASILKYNDENSLACVLTIAYFSAGNYYTIDRELPAGKGYADIVFKPLANITMPAMIIELKYDKTAKTAIKQIKDRKYVSGLKGYHGEVLLVGINYNKGDTNKRHECKIEKIKI